VCAGVKQILDIGRTLEYLETEGVPVVTIGQDEFPAFFSASSGFPSPVTVATAGEVAQMIFEQRANKLGGGLLIGNPIPSDAGLKHSEIERHIEAALAEASEKGIAGKAVTPFLLSRVSQLSGGSSLTANIALVRIF
jgi:pseudouridylate synthase